MADPGVGAGSIFVVVGFCSCLSLFMDIGRIFEGVEFRLIFQLIQGRVLSARTLVVFLKRFPRRPNAGSGGIDAPPSASNNRCRLLNNEIPICSNETTYFPARILLFTGRARIPTFAGVRAIWGTTCFVGDAFRQP